MKPLHRYAKDGNLEGIVQELKNGAFINEYDPDCKMTPLGAAARSYRAGPDVLRFLLDHGADIHMADDNSGSSVLGFAMEGSDPQKVRVLLAAGAHTHDYRTSLADYLGDAFISKATGMINLLVELGARWEDIGWTPLMQAVGIGSIVDVERELAAGGDVSARDQWGHTAFALSVFVGDLEKVELLGPVSDINLPDLWGQTPLLVAVEENYVSILAWLIEHGAHLDTKDKFGATALIKAAQQGSTECVRLLLSAGARTDLTDKRNQTPEEMKEEFQQLFALTENPPEPLPDHLYEKMSQVEGARAIERASNLEIVRLLIQAGEDLNDINDGMRASLLGFNCVEEMKVSREIFEAGWARRFGATNPELMDIPFWKESVRSGAEYIVVEPRHTNFHEYAPIWSYQRFGKSLTELPDGRFIEIGGEYEDAYDPQFCIYNEVFVHFGGGRFQIFGYPPEVFPPTDFHTATLAGDFIYIIGNAGYSGTQVYGETPVYRLDTNSYAIDKVETKGDKPGWISRHKARYIRDAGEVGAIYVYEGKVSVEVAGVENYIPNAAAYLLDLATMTWTHQADPS